jgi:hypothetical protein
MDNDVNYRPQLQSRLGTAFSQGLLNNLHMLAYSAVLCIVYKMDVCAKEQTWTWKI